MKKRVRFKLGDVFMIRLPNKKYAYGRVYKDASVGIYRSLTNKPDLPPIGSRDFLFNVGMYRDILTSGLFPIVGHDPFSNEEDAWPPPNFVYDEISGKYEIYHHGEMKRASKKQCHGLEQAAAWDSDHIIERIMEAFNSGQTCLTAPSSQ